MATTPLRPLTATGALLEGYPQVRAGPFGAPVPNCPFPLFPQAQTVPSLFSARLWPPPPAMATTPLRPLTATGVLLLIFVPLPSCPKPLNPQAQTVPSRFRARVWYAAAPAAMADTPLRP